MQCHCPAFSKHLQLVLTQISVETVLFRFTVMTICVPLEESNSKKTSKIHISQAINYLEHLDSTRTRLPSKVQRLNRCSRSLYGNSLISRVILVNLCCSFNNLLVFYIVGSKRWHTTYFHCSFVVIQMLFARNA